MIYRASEDCYYGTDAERLADTEVKAQKAAKLYVYETGKLWVSDGTVLTAGASGWHTVGEAD